MTLAPTAAAEERPRPPQQALLFVLGLATFMVSLDARVVAPLLPTIARDFDTSVAKAGWLVSSYLLPYGAFQLGYGPLADRFGKVRVATYAMIAFSIGTACCGAFASFAAIVALRALTGAAAAALIPLAIAYIGDTVPYERRQAALGMIMASAGAAQAFSTSAGGLIAALVSWRTVFPLLGVLAGAVTFALYCVQHRELRPPVPSALPRYRDALTAPRMPALLALVAFEGFLFMGGFPFLSGLCEQRFKLGAWQIGLLLGLAGVAQLAVARLLPRLVTRLSEVGLVRWGGTAMAAAYALCAVSTHWLFVAAGCLLIGAGFGLCHTTLQTRATELFARGRATGLALFAFSLFSGSALGSVCIGTASEHVGYGATFAGAGAGLLLFTAIATRTLGLRSIGMAR